MINSTTFSSGNALSSYLTTLLAKTATQAGDDASQATSGTGTVDKALRTAMATPVHTFKNDTAQHRIDAQQTALATDLRASLAKAGVALSGSVEFSQSDDELLVKGNDQDRAAVAAFLKSDKSTPGFTARLATLTQKSEDVSAASRQATAISLAARHAGGSSGVMSLYTSLMQLPTTPAVFTLSAASSSISYAGVLNSQA